MPGVFLNATSKQTLISKFQHLRSIEDFVDLLNWLNTLKKSSDKVTKKPIDSKLLWYLAISKESKYTHHHIPKKSGDMREIKAPEEKLKEIQHLLNCVLQVVFEPK